VTDDLKTLIERRCRDLGLGQKDVIRRAGYRNLARGHRRLDALLAGDLHSARSLIANLPTALDVPTELVQEAVAETERRQRAAQDAAYRAAFKPHAVILTEHDRPTHITFAAITGADQQLRIDFDRVSVQSSTSGKHCARFDNLARSDSTGRWLGWS
jgi:hypothetical protein